MKVIGISGSPRKDGNTDRLVQRVLGGAAEAGAETRFFRLVDLSIKGCVSCYFCRTIDSCAINDDMHPLYEEIHAADAVVLGSPVYMGQMSGQTKIFMDRLLPLLNPDFTTRLKNRPALVLAFTQGQADLSMFRPYVDGTAHAFGFLGFAPAEVLIAGGTREKSDVESQPEMMAEAHAVGKRVGGAAEADS